MTQKLLYVRSRRVMSVVTAFVCLGILLVLINTTNLVWSPIGGTAFPVAIIIPLGLACVVSVAEDSDTRAIEVLASRSLAARHACVSSGYFALGCLVIAVAVSQDVQVTESGLQYGVASSVRNFCLLTGLSWLSVPLFGGLRACVVPALVVGLATTVFSGQGSPPEWNLLLIADDAPAYIWLIVCCVVGSGLTVATRSSLLISPHLRT